nr:creatininase family protein [Anaerolineae bacterium]
MAPGLEHKRLHRLTDVTLETLKRLDRDHTIVILPTGMVEEHGPHLPLGTDTYAVEAVTLAAVAWLLDHDEMMNILLLPTLPYGTDPVDLRRPELFSQAGSVWISHETLKALVLDIAGHMVRYGFNKIFPIGFHGGADQSRTLDEACREMRECHPGLIMYEPAGYVMAGAELDVTPGLATLLGRPLSPAEEVVLRGSVHASMFETSMMLSLKPELVDRVYKTLRSIEWGQLYQMKDWPGYVGAAPAHANPDIGAAVIRWRGVRAAAVIRRAINGEEISKLPRHPAWLEDLPEEDSRSDIQAVTNASAGAGEPTPPSAAMRTTDITKKPTDDTRSGDSQKTQQG